MATADPRTLEKFEQACANIDARVVDALTSLHPDMRTRVIAACERLGGRLSPWTGHRSSTQQARRKSEGRSNAGPGESPHNVQRPDGTPAALGCDLVLDPRLVRVKARSERKLRAWPDLWDDESPEALRAWADLEDVADDVGLDRIRIPDHRGVLRRDRPHVQLPRWRAVRFEITRGLR